MSDNPHRVSAMSEAGTVSTWNFLQHVLLRSTCRATHYVDTAALLIRWLHADNPDMCDIAHVSIFWYVSADLRVWLH